MPRYRRPANPPLGVKESMKRLLVLVGLAALAACSAPATSSLVPSAAPMAGSTAISTALGDLRAASVDAAKPNAKKLAIQSMGLIGTINGKPVKGYIPAKCSIVDKGGIAVGCGLTATQTLHISKLTAGLFTLPKATGCLAADGTYHGTVQAGKAVPIVFHWTGKC